MVNTVLNVREFEVTKNITALRICQKIGIDIPSTKP